MPYADVGLISGNPPGLVSSTDTCGSPASATVTVAISYVNDPTPTSYATAANYKKVVVTVTRDRDNREMSRVVTFVAPPSRAPYGGINNAIINAHIVDLGLSQPYVGASVTLSNGPSPSSTDITDSTGTVSFAALTPNPTSGAQSYYDLTVAVPGYDTLPTDIPPGTATPPATSSHIQVAPSQTSDTSIQIFKPATINAVLQSGGSPFTGGATLKVLSSFTGATTTISVPAGQSSKAITMLGSMKVIPGATYTIHGYTTGGLCADPSPSPVPASGYPGNTAQTFTLDFVSCPMGNLSVNVKQLGANAPCAPVTLSNGPNDITLTGTTDAVGNAVFNNVPSGSGYSIDVGPRFSQTVSGSTSVATGTTTNKALVLPNPPTTTVTVNVSAAGQLVGSGIPVTLSGGGCGMVSQTVNTVSGVATFPNVPTGSGFPTGAGYTASVVSYNGQSGSQTISNVTSSYSTTIVMPVGTINTTVTWAGAAAGVNPSAGTVTITGGPFGGTYTGSTNASGVAGITVPTTTASYPYTVKASKNGSTLVTGTAVTSVTTGTPATSTVALTPTKTLTLTIYKGLSPGTLQKSVAVRVSITGGPNGTSGAATSYSWTGTTNATTGVTGAITVPAGTGNYTVKVQVNPCSGTASNLSNGTGTTVTAAAGTTTANIYMSTSGCLTLP